MVYGMVGCGGQFIAMTIKAVYLALVGVHDDLINGAAAGYNRVNITGRIMTGHTSAVG